MVYHELRVRDTPPATPPQVLFWSRSPNFSLNSSEPAGLSIQVNLWFRCRAFVCVFFAHSRFVHIASDSIWLHLYLQSVTLRFPHWGFQDTWNICDFPCTPPPPPSIKCEVLSSVSYDCKNLKLAFQLCMWYWHTLMVSKENSKMGKCLAYADDWN